jgi:hypothetical protein
MERSSGRAPYPAYYYSGADQDICPLPRVPVWFWDHILPAYEHYDSGYLLYAGGILDQPAWYYTAMAIVRAAVKGAERERRVEWEKQQGR